MHRDPRYYQKSVKNQPSKPNQQNLTHFGWYLGTRCIFFKTDFCVETVSPSRSIWIPWTLQSEQIFFSLIKGSEPPLGLPVGIVPDHLESWNFFWYLLWPILMGKCSQLIQIQKFCIFEHPYVPSSSPVKVKFLKLRQSLILGLWLELCYGLLCYIMVWYGMFS